MTETTKQTAPALDVLADMAQFAYREGFHEMGCDPVETVRKLLAQDRATVSGAQLQEALTATLLLADFALENGYAVTAAAQPAST